MKIVLQQYESVEALTVTGDPLNTELSSQSGQFTPVLKYGNGNLSLTTNIER